MSWLSEIANAIAERGPVVRVTVVRADGSTPREVGAAMLVSDRTVHDTIGGGALELAAIAHARVLLDSWPEAISQQASDKDASLPPAATGFPSPLWGGARGGGNPDINVLQSPPPCPSPTRGEGTLRRLPRFDLDGGNVPQWRRDVRDFPLGPSLGQCCGGYVRLLFEVLTLRERDHLLATADLPDGLLLRPLDSGAPLQAIADRKEHRAEWSLAVTRVVREMLSAARPREPALVRGGKGGPVWFVEPVSRRRHPLYVYGAGHVGRALVRVLDGLPFAVTWVDTSADRFPETIPPHAKPEIARNPAAFAGSTAGDAFHIVLTYSHALDLAICHSLLSRGDFRFLGLIGSQTKRARFVRRLSGLGIADGQLARLVCPIGLPGIAGKEPAMIALSVAVQLAQLTSARSSAPCDLHSPSPDDRLDRA